MQGYRGRAPNGRGLTAFTIAAFTAGGAALGSGTSHAQPADTPAAKAPSETVAVEKVVVTAERRSTDLQKTPITMTVVPQDQLDIQNIQTTTDLTRAVPALTATNLGVFQIRSIGTQGFGRSAEQSVSVVLDGVVMGRALTNSLYDIERVEVLSGPQGTLFGKNATAGVLNIVTRAPVLGEYQVLGHADFGDHDYIHSYVVGNVPVGDDAALRMSFHGDTTGEVVYNTIYNRWDYNRDIGGRARFLWQPNDDLTINLSADYQKLSSNGVNGVADFAGVQVYSFAPAGSLLEARLAACGVVASENNNRVCQNSLRDGAVDLGDTYGRWNGGGSVTIDYNLPWDLALTSITAVRHTENEDFGVHANLAGQFGDTLPQNLLDRNLVPYYARTWSEELRIASPAEDSFNFVAGVYYSKTHTHDQIDQSGQLGVPLGTLQFRRFIDMYIDQENYAVFGQVNWQVTPELRVFAGGRITHDEVSDFSFNSFPQAFPAAGPFIYTGNTGFFSVLPVNSCTLAGGVPYDAVLIPCPAGTSTTEPGVLEETGLSGKFGVQYEFSPQLMVFASVARGYKGPFMNESVTFTPSLARQPIAVESEFPLDFELGFKSTILDRFVFDVSLFTNKIEGFQTTVFVPPVPPLTVANFIQANAPHAITRGVEVSFFGRLTDNLNLRGGAIYNDAHFSDNFLVNCGTGPCPALRQMPYAPRWKATLAGEYRDNLFDQIEGFIQSDLAYSSPYPYGSAPGFPGSPARYLWGLRAGVSGEDDRWRIAVFCRNCLDNFYPIARTPDGFGFIDGGTVPAVPGGPAPVGFPTYQFLSIDSYRVVGVTVDFRY